MLRGFFTGESIEYFSVIPYSKCKIIRQDIIMREKFLPKSVIVYLVPYYAGETVNLSRYAASRDYHLYIRELNLRLFELLKEIFPHNSFKGYGDSSPIDERHAALVLGLGMLGENQLLINEKYGSYVFIGEMITDIEPELLVAVDLKEIEHCSGCGRCKTSCPTGRLENRDKSCLSEITQRKGELSQDEIEIMKKCGTVWGCDLCQTSCPHNENTEITPISFFSENRIENLSAELISSMSDEEFGKRAFSWRGRKTLERNLKYIK